jgi:thiol:disulfide interchange protein DsbD
MRAIVLGSLLLWLGLGLASGQAQQSGVSVNAFLSQDKLTIGQTFRIAVVMDLPEPWHANANPPSSPDFIPTSLTFAPSDAVTFGKIEYPAGKSKTVTWADNPVLLYSGHVVIFTDGKVTAQAPGPFILQATVRYQACDDHVCYAPKNVSMTITTEVVAAGQPVQSIHPEIFGAAAPSTPVPPAESPATKPANSIGERVHTHGLWLTLIFLFLQGLALNLTPCVYPMIAITVSYFGGRGERSLGKAFVSAMIYFLGIVLTYSVLGLVAARTGGLFGSLLQSPAVLIGVAVMLVALALSMFGLYELQPPQFLMQKAAGLSSKAGYVGLFFLGSVVGIIAAPCVGPIQAALFLYVADKGDPWLGWWLFFTLSAGLGLPYVLLGTFPGLLQRLPKSGTWMVRVKYVFGVILLGVAVWFTSPLWFHSQNEPSLIAWQPYSAEALAKTGHPVIVDFYADWCIPCKEMDRTTYRDSRVVEESKKFVMLKADLTRTGSPTVDKLTQDFKIAGAPTMIFIDAAGHEHTELRQVGLVGADAFWKLMKQAENPASTNSSSTNAFPAPPASLMQPF